MRKLIFILFFFIPVFCFSQTFIQRSSGVITVIDVRGGALSNWYMPYHLTDTSLNGGLDTLGALLHVRSGAKQGVWYRDSITAGGHKWTLVGSGGSSGVTSFNGRTGAVSPATGDYNVVKITGLQDSLNTRVDTIYSVNDSTVRFTINHLVYTLQIKGGVHGGGAGTGTVTNVSGVNANGFTWSITNPTSIPAITLTLQNGAADGSTKGQLGLAAADFNTTTGIASIDYTNGQAASTSLKGFLTNTDWNTFNGKSPLVTGALTPYLTSNAMSSRVIVSDGSGKLSTSATTSTEIGYLSGVTNNLQFLVLQYTTQTLTDAATITMNCNSGFKGIVTLAGNRTLAFSNFPTKGDIQIKVIQDATGSRTLTLPANSKVPIGFGSGTTINLTTTGLAYDILFCSYDGTYYNWTIAKQFQ